MAEICSLNASYNIVVLLTDEGTIELQYKRATKQPGPMSTSSLEFLVLVLTRKSQVATCGWSTSLKSTQRYSKIS
jgi:hypothetical protein